MNFIGINYYYIIKNVNTYYWILRVQKKTKNEQTLMKIIIMHAMSGGGQNQMRDCSSWCVVQGHGFQEYWTGDPGNTVSPQLHTAKDMQNTHTHTPWDEGCWGPTHSIIRSYILEADLREGKRTGRWQLSNSTQITHRRLRTGSLRLCSSHHSAPDFNVTNVRSVEHNIEAQPLVGKQ